MRYPIGATCSLRCPERVACSRVSLPVHSTVMEKPKRIGFIGQGYIGKNYADDFEERGYAVVRYSLEEPYVTNRDQIRTCDVVFIAVPTPTTHEGADARIVDDALDLVGAGKVAVIKSTVLPGTTESLAAKHRSKLVLHSPEFLSKNSASHDARHPKRNIVGVPVDDEGHQSAAKLVHAILSTAPFVATVTSRESEFLKYVNNTFFYAKIVYMNLLYDLAQNIGCDWEKLRPAIAAEPWIGNMHIDPVHKTGRGAGGVCFIKDYAAFALHARDVLREDPEAVALIDAIEKHNVALLRRSNKDAGILADVYGEL